MKVYGYNVHKRGGWVGDLELCPSGGQRDSKPLSSVHILGIMHETKEKNVEIIINIRTLALGFHVNFILRKKIVITMSARGAKAVGGVVAQWVDSLKHVQTNMNVKRVLFEALEYYIVHT